MALISRDVEPRVAFTESPQFSIDGDALLEQELHDGDLPVRARHREPLKKQRLLRVGRPRTNAIETAETRRFDEANRRASACQVLGGLWLPVRQAAVHERGVVSDRSAEVHARTVREQYLDDLTLHACLE